MKIYRGVEAIEYAIHEDVDFLAYIVSPWHLLGVQAVIHKIKKNDSSIRGIIMLCKNHCNEYVIDKIPRMENIEFVYYETGELYIGLLLDVFRVMIRRKKENRNKKYFIIPYKLDALLYAGFAQKNKELHTVECYVIDEGLGSYIGIDLSVMLGTKKGLGRKQLVLLVRKKMLDLLNWGVKIRLENNKLFNDFTLLKRTRQNHLVDNESVIPFYKYAMSCNYISDHVNNSLYRDAILINTQPLEGVEDEADINILYEFCKLCYENKLRVVIKPHPAQKDLDKYTKFAKFVCWDMRNEVTQEAILSSLEYKPIAVVSFYSTTLITSRLFWDIPSYSFAKILLFQEISSGTRNELTSFINLFSEQTVFCDSIEYLVNKLKK